MQQKNDTKLHIYIAFLLYHVYSERGYCWGVDNNDKGTNTNRVAVFRKP